ncbi:uncharacterized protein LTR77_010276 [Saxophila tyrrhenica]|uniref:Uncharacterized protein n=1 Tax=Saxophila tyrrhenica TaxID=1690608 RepID=A0AAV9NZK9_9PEZI|nr:hypothetical protein LTR77_010276 [Saxophila tyrrhenica]
MVPKGAAVDPGAVGSPAATPASSSAAPVSSTTAASSATKPATAVPAALEGVPSRPSSRASLRRIGSSQIMPAVPLRPATPIRAVTPTVTPKIDVKAKQDMETPTKAPKAGATNKEEPPAQGEAKTEVKDVSNKQAAQTDVALPQMGSGRSDAEKQPSTDNAARAKVAPPKAAEQTNVQTQKTAPPVSKATQPAAKGQATVQSSSTQAAPATPRKAEAPKNDQQQKRKQPPGKLDISAATKDDNVAPSSKKATETPGPAKEQQVAASPATSKVESPSVASPAVKAAPKTLRVVATPKTETPPSGVTTPKEPLPAVPPVPAKAPSRKPSVASIHPPGTPSSEHVSVSDNLSMTSASQSRANSPPPAAGSSKVGSAPVKAKTKNQLKKERRAKMVEEVMGNIEEVTKTAPEEPAQEAIVSRKKKTKKEKEPKPPKPKAPAAAATATGESTPTASRPVTPQQVSTPPVAVKTEPAAKEAKASKPATPTKVPASQGLPLQSPGEPSPPPTPTLSAAQIVADLKTSDPDTFKCLDSLFRPPTSAHYKPTQPITAKDFAAYRQEDGKLNLTLDNVRALLSGAVPAHRYGGTDNRIWDRGYVTPFGTHVRALPQEQEERLLELERAVYGKPEDYRFKPSKPQNEIVFPDVDLRAVEREFENVSGRGVSVMEQMVQDQSTMRKGAFLVDEASRYINEFVMPPATPPPSAGAVPSGSIVGGMGVTGAQMAQGQAVDGAAAQAGVAMPNMAFLEQQLSVARKEVEEREKQLKKAMNKNRKALGLA